VVHGDPMFKVNGTGSHFWMLPNVLTPLLTWTSPAGKDMVLSGITFETPDAANQWCAWLVARRRFASLAALGSVLPWSTLPTHPAAAL
jgi:hypothetical protein